MRRVPLAGRPRTRVAIATVLAVVAGVAVRFLTTSSLWLDEALSLNIASLPVGDVVDALRRDGHPPLYYWALHWWMELFGDGDVAVRALSGVISVLTLPLVWRLGRRTGGPAVARWSLVLVALSPFVVRYGTEARMYSLVMFLVVAGALVLDGVLERPRPVNVVGLTLIVAALLWTHYWSLYLLACVGALLLVRWWRSPAERPRTRWAVAALAGGGLLFAPWVPVLLDQAAHTGTPWGERVRPTVVAQMTIADLGGGGFAEALLLGTALMVLVVAAYAHLDRATLLREPDSTLDVRLLTVVVGGTLLLGSAVSYLTGSTYASRYGAVVAPFVLVIAAVGVIRLRPIWLQRAIGAAVVVLAGVAIVHNIGDPRTSADRIAARIERGASPGDVVVACPDQLAPALERQLTQRGVDLELLPYPAADDPRFVDWRDYEERNAAADPGAFALQVLAAAEDSAIWFVWNGAYRTFEGDCEDVAAALGVSRVGTATDPVAGAFESAALIRYARP